MTTAQTCATCGTPNPSHARYCASCGAGMQAVSACASCGAGLPPRARFCLHCGVKVQAEAPAAPGPVVDGAWQRVPGDVVRKVELAEMRNTWQKLVPGLDLDAFFKGTLAGELLERVQSRSVKIPPGCSGVVVLDGAVRQILPPGEATPVGWLRELVRALEGDLEGAGAALLDRLSLSGRMRFYLVDRRPLPLALSFELPGAAEGQRKQVQVQALLRPGNSPQAMAAFIDQVVGASLSLSAQELHARLKGELERQAEQLLHRHPADLGRAEAELRRALAGRLDLLGLEMELVVAEREGLLRLELLMGSPQAPLHASCSACQSSVPAGMRFCPRCGARQEPGAEPTAERLITRDQEEVELDVVLVVGSRGRGLGEGPVRQALFAALARRLRGLAAAELEPQLDALAAALSSDLDGALAGLGLRVHQLAILDLRRRGQEWERAVRAEMARARGEAALGREWLGVEELELANQALTLALQLRREKVVGEHLLSQAELQLDQERRRAAIEAGQRELLRARQAAEHDDQVTAAQRSGQLSELAAQQQSARLRQQADDEAYADQRRREGRLAELERLAALDRQMADQDMRHRKELSEGRGAAEIIALQASELAGKTHGGDFARALAAMSQGEAVQKEREGTVLAFRRAAEQATSMAERSMEAHARVAAAAAGASALGRACAHCGTRLGRQDTFCPECGQKS